jgi:hypothetical protein
MNKLLTFPPPPLLTMLLAFAVVIWYLRVRKIPLRTFSGRLGNSFFDFGLIVGAIGLFAMLIWHIIYRLSN